MLLKTCLLLAGVMFVPQDDLVEKYRQSATERWEQDIQQLERLDAEQQDPPGAILFVGSSSIRLWKSMAKDMHPWPTIRRGYGGAKFSDLAVFAERLIYPHDFKALVIFVANDISGSKADKSPAEVLRLYQHVVGTVRAKFPSKPIFFISITPTSKRFDVWPKIKQVNSLVEQYSGTQSNLHFIDTADAFLLPSGRPNDALFRNDLLHLNAEGYRIWAKKIKSALAAIE